MLKKYDTFFLLFTIINFFISFLCLIIINLPSETWETEKHTLSENLNNYYMQGKKWKIENGLFMLFTGIGMIGIFWLSELDLKMEYVYKRIYKCISEKFKYRHDDINMRKKK